VPLVLRARRCSACRWPSPRSALRRRMKRGATPRRPRHVPGGVHAAKKARC
jgi:hypothetical protein